MSKPTTLKELAQAFGRLGGRAAAKKLTKAQRSARAKHAVACREVQRAAKRKQKSVA